MHDDDYDAFDWDTWGVDTAGGDRTGDGATAHDRAGHNAHAALHVDATNDDHDDERTSAGWVTAGGVVQWADADDSGNPGHEADSPLAADELDIPAGAPDAPRVRAVHAWVMRQRARELEALGRLLLAQRTERQTQDNAPPSRRRRGQPRADSTTASLDVEIAEHQAAADEYSAQLERLEDFAAHGGAGRVLVEYYLWLSDYLATLASAPDASDAAGPPQSPAGAAWRGRALAALAVRGRVERMAAPSAEED